MLGKQSSRNVSCNNFCILRYIYLPIVAIVHPKTISIRPKLKALQAFQRHLDVTFPRTTCTFHCPGFVDVTSLFVLCAAVTVFLCRIVDCCFRLADQLAPRKAPWCIAHNRKRYSLSTLDRICKKIYFTLIKKN